MSRKVTIQDVARDASVSITTVSRYLNQRYDSMSVETKMRIERVIEELHYQPNAFAQGLKANKSKMMAVVVVNIGYPFCVSLIRSLNHVLSTAGYNLIVCETGGQAKREAQILKSLAGQRVDAMVLQTNGENNDLIAEIAGDMPVVLVDRQFSIPGAMNVITDNRESSLLMTTHLIKQGYHQIIYVTEAEGQLSTRVQRLSGYLAGCEEQGYTPWVGWVNREDKQSFDRLIQSIRARATASIAVYTANALLMLELHPLLQKIGFEIPQRLGLATFDEPDWAGLTTPSLTCVRQPVEDMGQITADILLRQLKTGKRKPGQSVKMMPSTQVYAQSTDHS